MMLAALLAAAFALCPAEGRRHDCVVDGDTFWIGREKVRLVDIDAPELHGACLDERRRAIAARDRLLALLDRGSVAIERRGLDKYGRTLALVTAGGVAVGPVLVREGLAVRWGGGRPRWCG